MKNHWFSTAPIAFTLVLAIGLGFIDAQNHSQFFTTDSLKAMRVLNEKNGMVVNDLSDPQKDSPLVAELLHADVLVAGGTEVNRENTGLVVTLNPDAYSQEMLLLQPTNPISEIELATLAEEYKKAIPEFENVELDQDLELTSPFYDWMIEAPAVAPADDVELSSETTSEIPSMDQTKIRVAVIDSGVDASHEIFAKNPVETGWNTISDDTIMIDDVGHGTHIAGIIASESQNVEIIPYKIVDAKGGKLSNVIEAITKAIEDDVDVINMSFGVSEPSYALETLVEDAYGKNIIMVAAAGNNGMDHGFYPGEYEHTIAVASVDASGNKMPHSNYGDWVDVAAYGYHIRSSLPNNTYGYKSGTSQATAKVTAKVVMMLQGASSNDVWTLEQVLSGLQSEGEAIADGELARVTRLQ